MEVQTIDILAALGEQTAQNFLLRRRIAELEEEVTRLYAREADYNQPKAMTQFPSVEEAG